MFEFSSIHLFRFASIKIIICGKAVIYFNIKSKTTYNFLNALAIAHYISDFMLIQTGGLNRKSLVMLYNGSVMLR